MKKHGAGILVYRLKGDQPEVLLGHPGGPFWAKKDLGVWSIPKGDFEEDEEKIDSARREFKEEIGQDAPIGSELELGEVKRRDGRIIFVWAVEGDLDVSSVKSNTLLINWPPRSGKKMEIPEIDRAEWFDFPTATRKIHDVQIPFLERLAKKLGVSFDQPPEAPSQASLF